MLAELSSVPDMLTVQALHMKRQRPHEPTTDTGQSDTMPEYVPPLFQPHPGYPYPSNNVTGTSSQRSRPSFGISSAPPRPIWPSHASFLAESRVADTGIIAPVSASFADRPRDAPPGVNYIYEGALANLPAMPHVLPASTVDSSSVLVDGSAHHHPEVQQTFNASLWAFSEKTDPSHRGAPSTRGAAAEDLSAIFDLSSLEVSGAMDTSPNSNDHYNPPDTQCVAADQGFPPRS